MADNNEILSGLAEIVEEVAGIDTAEVTTEKSFVDDLDIDSLSMVEIAVQAEDKFGVKIPDDQLAELKTSATRSPTSPATSDGGALAAPGRPAPPLFVGRTR
jgi:acyl carrier protein